MGDLVRLPARDVPVRAVETGREAAILFFTGVRYYRMEEPAPLPADRRRPAPARKAPARRAVTLVAPPELLA